MNWLEKLSATWQHISLVQRALLAGIALAFLLAVILLVCWAKRPDMRVLYRELEPGEAGKITEKISDKGISYELRDGGTSVYVPKEEIYQLRLDMAKEGLPSGGRNGYKIFDDEKIGISPFVQNVNLKRAVQDELSRSIQMLEGVVHARVHIVTPERTIFKSNSKNTTASVVLRLMPGYKPGGSNISAITHLVAGAVEDLDAEKVTVVDSRGRLLSGNSNDLLDGGAGTVQDYRERVERNCAQKVESMLAAVLGAGRAKVSVNAVIDMNSINTVKESYDPDSRVMTKEEIQSGEEKSISGESSNGENGVPGSTKKDETTVTEYVVGKVVEKKVELPGEVKSLRVAAFVDLSAPADANDTEGTAQIMEISEVEEVITNALGLEDDSAVKVVNVRFNRPSEPIEASDGGKLDLVAIAGQASLGIMAICALLVLRMFGGGKKKQKGSEGLESLAEGGVAGLLPGEGGGPREMAALRKQIAGALHSNPEQVKQLFMSWVEEKG